MGWAMKRLLLISILSMIGFSTHVAAVTLVPAVIAIRHAEEFQDPNDCIKIDNTAESDENDGAHQKCLHPLGQKHAQLYIQNNVLDDFLASHHFSAISKVIVIDPKTNDLDPTKWPTSNPYFTIQPYFSMRGIKPVLIHTSADMNQKAVDEVEKGTSGSTLIVWESKQLEKSGDGLLDLLSKKQKIYDTNPPLRDTLYVFTNKDANNKYDVAVYSGFFKGLFKDNEDLDKWRREYSGSLLDLFTNADDVYEMVFCPGQSNTPVPNECP